MMQIPQLSQSANRSLQEECYSIQTCEVGQTISSYVAYANVGLSHPLLASAHVLPLLQKMAS